MMFTLSLIYLFLFEQQLTDSLGIESGTGTAANRPLHPPDQPVKNLPLRHMQYFNVRIFPRCPHPRGRLHSNERRLIVLSVIQGLMSTPCMNIPCSTIISTFLLHTSYAMIFSLLEPGGIGSQYTSMSEADTARAHTLDGASEGSKYNRR